MKKTLVKEPAVISTITTQKDFKYSKDGVNLNFSLSIDNSAVMEAFKLLLKAALRDVEKALVEYKNK